MGSEIILSDTRLHHAGVEPGVVVFVEGMHAVRVGGRPVPGPVARHDNHAAGSVGRVGERVHEREAHRHASK